MKLCYTCIHLHASSTGLGVVGNLDGMGVCSSCKKERPLYEAVGIARKPEVVISQTLTSYTRSPAFAFGWGLVLMAVALALTLFFLSRCAEGAEKLTLDEWTKRAIHKLPVYYEDRMPGGIAGLTTEKQLQLQTLAEEIARVSAKERRPPLPPRHWAALILTVGYHESTFSLRIHQGHCKPYECDRGKSRGPFQQKQNIFTRPVWDQLHGLDGTRVQVEAVDAFLRRHVMTCPRPPHADDLSPVEGILTGYAGQRCGSRWKGLDARIATFWKVSR